MNKTQNTRKFLLLLLVFFASFSSCVNKSHKEIQILQILNESLVNSNNTIAEENQLIYSAIENKSNDPATHDKMTKWVPKAKLIQKLSTDIFNHIEQLKKN